MADFDWAVDLAMEALAENGESVTVTSYSRGTEGSTPGRPGAPVEHDDTVLAVFLPYGTMGRFGMTQTDNSEVLVGDQEVLIAAAALTAEPKPGTTIARTDGTVWVVQGVDQLNPAGTPILYTLWARR